MDIDSSATTHPTKDTTITAGELTDALKGVSAFVFEHGPEWMTDAVEIAIAKLSAKRRSGPKKICVARLEGYLKDGLNRRQIADLLGCSEQTVMNWVNTLLLPKPARVRTVRKEPTFHPPRDWTEDEDGKLRDLWMDGYSANYIGFFLDRSRNSVIGRAHRLGLPSRPSPIKRAA